MGPWRNPRLLQAAVAAAAILLYAPTVRHGFAFDDGAEIVGNADVREQRWIPILSAALWSGSGIATPNYRPLTTLSYALNHALGGLEPSGYHAVNVALHAGVAVLLLLIAQRLGIPPPGALAGALLFAIHPIAVEAVANVSGRKELLVALFILATLGLHRRAADRGGLALAGAPAACAAAMLSKETGVVAFPLAAAWDLLAPGGALVSARAARRRTMGLHAVYAVLLATFLLLRQRIVGAAAPEVPLLDNPLAHAPAAVRLATALVVVARGLGLLLLPRVQSPDYSFDALPLVERAGDPRLVVAALAVAALAAAAAWAAHRGERRLLLLAAWYGLTLLPVANLLFPIGTIFGERLLYVPAMALCLGAGILVAKVAAVAPHPALAAVAAAALLLAARTHVYAAAWHDDLSLFTEARRVMPRSAKVHHKLGEALAALGRHGEAAAAYEEALAILPDRHAVPTLVNLGASCEELGRLDEAGRAFERALAVRPETIAAIYGLASVRRGQGRLDEAAALWRDVLRRDPGHAAALGDLGSFHFTRGELGEAAILWQRAAASDPDLATVWYNLGMLHESRGDLPAARTAWRRFLEVAGDELAPQRAVVAARLAAASDP